MATIADTLRDQGAHAQPIKDGGRSMSSMMEHNMQMAREIIEAFVKGDASAVMMHCSDNVEWDLFDMAVMPSNKRGVEHITAHLSTCLSKHMHGKMGSVMAGKEVSSTASKTRSYMRMITHVKYVYIHGQVIRHTCYSVPPVQNV